MLRVWISVAKYLSSKNHFDHEFDVYYQACHCCYIFCKIQQSTHHKLSFVQEIIQRWLNTTVAQVIGSIVVSTVPSPPTAQAYRAEALYKKAEKDIIYDGEDTFDHMLILKTELCFHGTLQTHCRLRAALQAIVDQDSVCKAKIYFTHPKVCLQMKLTSSFTSGLMCALVICQL